MFVVRKYQVLFYVKCLQAMMCYVGKTTIVDDEDRPWVEIGASIKRVSLPKVCFCFAHVVFLLHQTLGGV